ncbi:uncharacterized protein [Prorops nasuta]|uniref:uncharacterized protein n=1 Tax=Prorops nasuta TaxID=863751 RepID=UPI0034CFF9B6
MIMENNEVCVLHWKGHAGYVSERFSELLARQALVDVTLVCEEQKLCVHKLVLASNSIYFEEILEQDLGQEPVILLKDLNFEILKAMVEFMYCGETTISHHHLQSLLTAAKDFKVKELALVINKLKECKEDTMENSNNFNIKVNERLSSNDSFDKCTNSNVDTNESDSNEYSLFQADSVGRINSFRNDSLDNHRIVNTADQEFDEMLYQDFRDTENIIYEKSYNNGHETSELFENPEIKSFLDKEDCNIKDFHEIDESNMLASKSCIDEINKIILGNTIDNIEVPSKIGKCVKVYTHKKRQPANKAKNNTIFKNNVLPNPSSTDCIDLLDEPSSNKIPVTLLTSLDMESTDYILSLTTENMQSILGCAMNEQQNLIKYKEATTPNNESIHNEYIMGKQKNHVNKRNLYSINKNINNIKPILRRSTRLNQQDIQETIKKNLSSLKFIKSRRQLKRLKSLSKIESSSKIKRRIKDSEQRVPDENIMDSNIQNVNNGKTQSSSSNKPKSNKKKFHLTKEVKTPEDRSPITISLNTVACISRSSWGDMSDILENTECGMDFLDYTPNGEIPFALGLLPLRTALEKMQATPEYQPRKTRSSVSLVKQEANCFKRKCTTFSDCDTALKKLNSNNNYTNDNASTVCHIQIRTAQYTKNRKTLSEHIAPDLDTLQPLKEFKNLKNLDLFNNEVTNMDNYRDKVFSLIPSLKYLDGFDIDDHEVDDSEGEDDEVNGNEDGEEDSEELSDEEDDDDLDEGGVSLDAVYKDHLEDESDEEDYVEGEEEEEEDDDEDDEPEEEEESSPARGKKRKHEDGGESGN